VVYKLSNPYHSQRNNAIDPAGTCQVTAAIMALRATGIPFDYPSGIQPEDHLAEILGGQEAREKLLTEYPTLSNRPPREVHAILSWAINERFVRRKVSVFTVRATVRELLYRVAKHRAASLVSGRFTKTGHVVCLVGFESGQDDLSAALAPDRVDLGAIRRIIIDDPWGDFKSGYRDPDGNDVSFTLDEFNGLTREYGEQGRKWAHLFDVDGIF
jgi:hypothetical protein